MRYAHITATNLLARLRLHSAQFLGDSEIAFTYCTLVPDDPQAAIDRYVPAHDRDSAIKVQKERTTNLSPHQLLRLNMLGQVNYTWQVDSAQRMYPRLHSWSIRILVSYNRLLYPTLCKEDHVLAQCRGRR